MTISVSVTRLNVINLETRIPFHFGNIEVTEIPKVFLQVTVDIGGTTQEGIAMGGLIPGWFYKDPEMSLEEGFQNMVETFQSAVDIAQALDPEPTTFAFWRSLYEGQRKWAVDTNHPPLLWSYGVSLVEQALVDAVCRAKDVTFGTAVRENLLEVDLGSVYNELAPYEPGELLPDEPQRATAVRHTVGLNDPLTNETIAGEQPNDELPLTLAEYVHEGGVNHFKIKLSADRETDANRLARITDVLADLGVKEYLCTVDANEGYDSAGEFKRQWETHATDSDLAALFEHLAYVEQPLPRDKAFTEETKEVFTSWDNAPPIIIDESDGRIDNAGTALAYGYAGTSHKNCKGVFKGIINACLIAHRNQTDADHEYVLSAEDLTTVGPIELLQDFAVTATIGADHVERNGHHYFRGLDAFPDDVQEQVLTVHSDLYQRHDDGFPTLDIDGGAVELDTIVNAPFGVAPLYNTSQFEPIERWLEGLSG